MSDQKRNYGEGASLALRIISVLGLILGIALIFGGASSDAEGLIKLGADIFAIGAGVGILYLVAAMIVGGFRRVTDERAAVAPAASAEKLQA